MSLLHDITEDGTISIKVCNQGVKDGRNEQGRVDDSDAMSE